jgi:hypothetical protein
LREKIEFLRQNSVQRKNMAVAALAFSQSCTGATALTMKLIALHLGEH